MKSECLQYVNDQFLYIFILIILLFYEFSLFYLFIFVFCLFSDNDASSQNLTTDIEVRVANDYNVSNKLSYVLLYVNLLSYVLLYVNLWMSSKISLN